MSNRSERRKEHKQRSGFMRMSPEQKKAAIYKNGITEKDLDREYAAGYKRGEIHTLQMVYAALMLAANETYKFGAKRALRLLKVTDQKVLETLNSEELIRKVFERFEVKLDFDAPIDRVKEDDGCYRNGG